MVWVIKVSIQYQIRMNINILLGDISRKPFYSDISSYNWLLQTGNICCKSAWKEGQAWYTLRLVSYIKEKYLSIYVHRDALTPYYLVIWIRGTSERS